MKNINEIQGKIYFLCTACMSVWADALSWANANREKIVKTPDDAQSIVVLSCQVTDLAVLNDLENASRLKRTYPGKKIFISGCLAKRKDIELDYEKLLIPRTNYQEIEDKTLVDFAVPFWVKDFKEGDAEYNQGHLFRYMYPLRIGKSCPFNCSYCTIKITRGCFESYCDYDKLEREFVKYKDVLLVADSPMPDQIKEWCRIAKKNNKHFSIRNVEPQVAVACKKELLDLAELGLLKVFHSPIQSSDEEVLLDMNRNIKATFETISLAKELKERGVFIATNIIIDYKDFIQDFSEIYDLYDYVSWNPYWNGKWNEKNAEERKKSYFEDRCISKDKGIRFK